MEWWQRVKTVVFRLMLKLNSMSSSVNEAHGFSIRTLSGATARNGDDQHQHQHQKQPHFWLPLMNDIDKTIFNFAFRCSLSLSVAFVRSSPLKSSSVHSYTQHDLDLSIHVCVSISILKSIELNAHYERISPNKYAFDSNGESVIIVITRESVYFGPIAICILILFARSLSPFPLNDSNGE